MEGYTSTEEPGPTYVSFGFVARIDVENIGALRKAIAAVPDTRIIYFRVAAGRLRIVEEEWPVESELPKPDGER